MAEGFKVDNVASGRATRLPSHKASKLPEESQNSPRLASGSCQTHQPGLAVTILNAVCILSLFLAGKAFARWTLPRIVLVPRSLTTQLSLPSFLKRLVLKILVYLTVLFIC